ncbi:hypothetical protein DSM104299_03148 [Baekduia alba]|uniref:hypothetical protein n=1 Tax=Baekduia alba TaxID=2997333 RepID=UPI00233FAC69|nr:hypothetical protein [Baekduia alba]WCB94412.1 hypothetical protein DSM104299_03148 [Baekduia alba]
MSDAADTTRPTSLPPLAPRRHFWQTRAIPRAGDPPGPPPPTATPWRESALTRASELRGRARDVAEHGTSTPRRDELLGEIYAHVAAAEQAATGENVGWAEHRLAALWGASVERASSQLDAAEVCLLRISSPAYVVAQLPALVAQTEAALGADDARTVELRRVAGTADAALPEVEREKIASIYRAAVNETRKQVTRVRSFRNVLLSTALALALCVAGLTVATAIRPSLLPLCFTPVDTAVCPTTTGTPVVPPPSVPQVVGETTVAQAQEAHLMDEKIRDTAEGWDVAVVELVGLVAAAVAAAVALRGMSGTSTPYSLPIALAVLKLPTGALSAVLGLLLMRGGFVPGLSALDTSEQILAWAVVFGAAQQAVTGLVDKQAQGVLDAVGTAGPGGPDPAAGAGTGAGRKA